MHVLARHGYSVHFHSNDVKHVSIHATTHLTPAAIHQKQRSRTAVAVTSSSPSIVCAETPSRSSRVSIIASAASEAGDATQSTPSTSGRFTEPELQQLWNSVSRSLLKLGKTGVTESHGRSLTELVTSHKLVKVQLNGAKDDPQAITAAAAQLEQQTAGVASLLLVKGSTMLFSSAAASRDLLLAEAEAAAAGTAAWRAKRAAAAVERKQQRELAVAKRESNASRSRKRIGQIISTVAKPSKGPVDKATLAEEWQQIAAGISTEEAAGSGSEGRNRRKAPWKK